MNLSSDEEIANDEDHDLNKVDGVVERQVQQLKTSGLTTQAFRELHHGLKGKLTIKSLRFASLIP